jgi:glutamine amidotransferase
MIVIIDYGMGNLGSIANMLKKVGAAATISSDIDTIKQADKLVLPGVGAFDSGMKNLAERGLIEVLNDKVLQDKTIILGLCLGMQLFTKYSEEGRLAGLGWLDAETVRFKFDNLHTDLKIPHMAWNTLKICQPHALFADADDNARFYFVHSYHVDCRDTRLILAETQYGYTFTSAVVKDNIVGVQFHPEKSHKFGSKLFRNFVEHT